jgi:hypothetical protein
MDYAVGQLFVLQELAIKHCPYGSQEEGMRLAKKLRWTMIKLRISE